MASLLAHLAEVIVPHAWAVSYAIPGNIAPSGSLADPAGLLVNFYQFGMLLAGVLAFGMVVWAGVQYSLSRGNPTGQADARDRVIQAFLGILLLVGAYAILYTLNPGLTRLQLPTLSPIDQSLLAGQQPGGYEGDISVPDEGDPAVDDFSVGTTGTKQQRLNALVVTGGCAANMSNCVKLNTVSGVACKTSASCLADQRMARILECANEATGRSVLVDRAYPQIGQAQDRRHATGCAVDLDIRASTCDQVKTYARAIDACGGVSLNEYSLGSFAGCGVPKTKYQKGNNLHFDGCN